MGREKIRESLDEAARSRGAGERDLWPGVEWSVKHSGQHRQKSNMQDEWLPLPGDKSSHRKRVRFNFGLAGVMVILVALVGVTIILGRINEEDDASMATPAVSSSPTVSQSSLSPLPPDEIDWGFAGHSFIYRLSSYVGISQTIGPVTVSLDRAYADANTLVIFYSVADAIGTRLLAVDKRLRLSDGSEPPTIYEGSASVLTGGASGTRRDGSAMHLVAFDAGTLDALPDKLNLEFNLSLFRVDDYKKMHETVIARSNSSEEARVSWQELSTQFNFTFDVPFTKKDTRVLHLDQSMEVNGETLTLERMVITPSEMRATLKYDKSDVDADKYVGNVLIWLLTGDATFDRMQQVPPVAYAHQLGSDDARVVYAIIWPFDSNLFGEWTLNVHRFELVTKQSAAEPKDNSPPKVVTGPWEFKFTVPPLGE